MSNEVKLPPLDVNLEDLEMSRKQDKLRKHICRDGLLLSIYCRERQLREAIAQIATLTAQVEELSKDGQQGERERIVLKAELASAYETIALEHGDVAIQRERVEKDEAELAALREGAVGLIAAERSRQISVEGWSPEHDDDHEFGQLSAAAAAYAMAARYQVNGWNPKKAADVCEWPWDISWFKPGDDPIRMLVKVGALAAAEIDRITRERILNAAEPNKGDQRDR